MVILRRKQTKKKKVEKESMPQFDESKFMFYLNFNCTFFYVLSLMDQTACSVPIRTPFGQYLEESCLSTGLCEGIAGGVACGPR